MNIAEELARAIVMMPRAKWQELGISARVEDRVGGVGMARVRPTRTGRFEFADKGEAGVDVFVVGVWATGTPAGVGDLIDLVAWNAADPTQFWTATGNAFWLNEPAVDEARMGGRLKLHPNPLAWLRASGEGAVLLGLPPHIALRHELSGVKDVVVPDEAFAKWVFKELRRRAPEPPPPAVMIAEQNGGAHARA